ncbi:FUN14 domain-containing protein 1 [Papilio machaon]|uniref:FUN14 domain-containing protein 1 n=1 Tax=Papilio machaon TaxID=76193 RepID=A0A0N1IB86_PAPMA|nr:FUN14 domain-containing protein 1 [Papilio machaon]
MKKCQPMAKPIPDLNLSDLSKYTSKPKEDSIFDVTINKISKQSSSTNLFLGTFCGWVTGVGVSRVGKVAAFGLGGGVILLHFACELGYIHVNWEKVKEGVSHCQHLMEKFLRFVKKNSCLSVGFVGGFFFGVAST